MTDLGRRKRSVSLPPRHVVFLEWNAISRSELIQEAIDEEIREAGFEPETVKQSLFALCNTGMTVEEVKTELDSCSELIATSPAHNTCN